MHDKEMVARARHAAKTERVIRKRPASGGDVTGEASLTNLTNAEKFVKGLVEIETPPFLPPCDPQQKGDQLVPSAALQRAPPTPPDDHPRGTAARNRP